MKFSEQLKAAMKQLEISQSQVVGMTGICKNSISQYLSGINIPTEERQKHIAISLGLAPDYFSKEDKQVIAFSKQALDKGIQRLDVMVAAKILGMTHTTVRKGLQQGVFPWGYTIKTSANRWTYFINAKWFAEIEGIET